MKTKDLIIGLLLVGIAVLGVLYYNKCQEVSSNADKQTTFSQSDNNEKSNGGRRKKCYTAEELCNMVDACGQGYTIKDTAEIRKMINARKSVFNKVYGYQIDLKHIDSLRESIRKFNEAGSDKDLKIIGLRFYEAKSIRKIQSTDQYEQDLVMIPYLSNCKDVYLVDDKRFANYPAMIYANFRPCPKLCSGEDNLFIHQGKGKVK